MQGTENWLSALTLKASYGAQGNDNLGSYYASSGLYTIISNNNESGLVTDRLATPNLKWETNLNFNVGIDFSLWNNRLSGSFDFFQRKSKDLLYSRPLASSLGYTSVDENVGALKNTGFEIELKGTIIDVKDFKWNMGLNLTHYKNKVTELPLKDMPQGSFTKLQEGRSVYDFYLKEWAGVNPDNGEPLWYMNQKDENGHTIKVTTNDYSKANYYFVNKSSLPKVYGGFNINLSYKAFDLSTVFSYSLGGKVLDSSYRGLMDVGEFGYAMSPDLHNAWTTPGQITDVPRLDNNSGHATSIGQSYSTRWLTNANYLNLRTVTLAYNLPKSILNVINIKSARVNVSAENLFMLKARQGLNPQANYAGVSYNEYMPAKNFTIGLNVSF